LRYRLRPVSQAALFFLSRDRKRGAALKTSLYSLCIDDTGQGLVEYALIISFIALIAFGAMVYLGKKDVNSLSNSANQIPT
jgi:Flp pilus assembly pilin Flp